MKRLLNHIAAGTVTVGVTCTAVPADAGENRSVIVYVDDDAPPGGDGSTWSTACRYLQDALTIARNRGDVAEILVAQGVYKPDQGAEMIAGDKAASFNLPSGAQLRGGYAGLRAPDPNARDWNLFITTISGDLTGNDGPNFANYSDNAWVLVRCQLTAPGTLIEGIEFTASDDDDGPGIEGGAILQNGGSLAVKHCRFIRLLAYSSGAVSASSALNSPHWTVVTDCIIEDNNSEYGGLVRGSSSHLQNTLLVERCIFRRNSAGNAAKGCCIHGSSATTIVRDCEFEDNDADIGATIIGNDNLRVERSVFRRNYALWGGAVAAEGRYTDCLFENNSADGYGGAYFDIFGSNSADFIRCRFINNRTYSNDGGAAYGGRMFVDCTFADNKCGLSFDAVGGAIATRLPATIVGCLFVGNLTYGQGGAIHIDPAGPATIINSTFLNNNPLGHAGSAISGPATICNSVFGPHARSSSALLVNITSIDYSCLPVGFASASVGAAWGAGAGNIIADARFVNPLGPDGIAGTEDDDLRLRSDSPCIDAGDTTALPADVFDLDGDGDTTEPLPMDASGNTRVMHAPNHNGAPDTGVPAPPGSGWLRGAIVDMGAHEHRRPQDVAPTHPSAGDGRVNVSDLLLVISQWGSCDEDQPCEADINGDGNVNASDLIAVILNWG